MFARILWVLILFSCDGFGNQIPDSVRLSYAQKFNEAFLIQSRGEARHSTAAFLKFNEAYMEAQRARESPLKLAVMLDLIKWYRIYGYGAGVMKRPSECAGEHIPPKPEKRRNYSFYESEWGETPEQAKCIRQFMLGVGMMISGVFAVTVNPAILGRSGVSLCIGGFTQMYLGLSEALAEKEQRIYEIQQIQQKTEKALEVK